MAQDYDKIVKENLKPNINALLEIFFKISVAKTQQLDIRLQHTIEKEPDFLFKVIEKKPKEDYAVQVEFQASDKEHENYIIYRCIIYKGLILFRERIPLRQFVVYMGNEPPRMKTEYKDDYTTHKIELINFKSIDYHFFLSSGRPELVVFAILADYKNQNPMAVIEEIIAELQKLVAGELEIQKYASQLRVLSRLRKFEQQTIKIINKMPKIFHAEDDVYYRQGIEKGIEKGEKIGEANQANISAVNMLLKTDFSIALIAELAGVEKSFVSNLKKLLDNTSIKKVVAKHQNVNTKIAKANVDKSKAIAVELLKIRSLSDEVIARIADLNVKAVLTLRKRQKKTK